MTLAFVGSNPAIPAISDPLAQLAEQLPFKQWVRGSNPRRVTKKEAATFVAASFCSRGGYVCLTGQFASRASRRVLAASSCLARARKENPNSLLALQL